MTTTDRNELARLEANAEFWGDVLTYSLYGLQAFAWLCVLIGTVANHYAR